MLIAMTSIILTFHYMKHNKLYVKAINQCVLMIENIEILLSYNSLSTQEIFRILSQNKKYHLLTFINKISENINSEVSSDILCNYNISYIKSNKYLKIEDKENIENFFSLLGKSDLKGQIINCNTYREIFVKKLLELENKSNKDCNSMCSLILGSGILMIILLL